jgi:hypothetical protein
LILSTGIAAMIYTFASKPFVDQKMNYLDVFNESTIMAIAYLTVPFSDIMMDPVFKFDIGWTVLYIFMANLFINIFFLLGCALLSVYKAIVKKLSKKKRR